MARGRKLTIKQRKERPQRPAMPTVVRAVKLHRPYARRLIALMSLISVSALLSLGQPLLIREIIDGALRPGRTDPDYLNVLIGAMIGLAVLTAGLSLGSSLISARLGQDVTFDLRNRMYRHIENMSLAWFTANRSGESISRITSDVNSVQGIVTSTLTTVVANMIVLVTTLILMFGIDWRLTLLCLVFFPLGIIPARRIGQQKRELTLEIQEQSAKLSGHMHESLSVSGALLMKTFGQQDFEARRFEEISGQIRDLNWRRTLAGRWYGVAGQLVAGIGPILIYWYGGHRFIDDQATLGTLVAFVYLLQRLFGPAQSMIGLNITLLSSVALFERVFDFLDIKEEMRERNGAHDIGRAEGHVRFDHVTFSYAKSKPVLHDVSFDAPPRSFVALVGHSGAGKTTTIYLALRLYDPDSGVITLDGHDLRDLTKASLARNVALVSQETYLFHNTIRENLRYGRPDATDEEIEAAARAANIHEFIAALPQGYETTVGERGFRLSGGEKQRVAIARAVLTDPAILILDEATSSVDSRTERAIQEAMDRLTAGRTVIAIAHRLSTILRADQILVYEKGRIVERGTHTELMAFEGEYAEIYLQQFRHENEPQPAATAEA